MTDTESPLVSGRDVGELLRGSELLTESMVVNVGDSTVDATHDLPLEEKDINVRPFPSFISVTEQISGVRVSTYRTCHFGRVPYR